MWQKKRTTKWWVWLVRLVILVIIIMAWWLVFAKPSQEVPDFNQQILDSVSQQPAENLPAAPEPFNNQAAEPDQPVEQPQPNSVEPQSLVVLDVPFTSQAPEANWDDDRFQDGCEEASVIMAMAWVKGEKITKSSATQAILALAQYQQDNYNNYHDTNAADTASRLLAGYYQYDNFVVKNKVSLADLKEQLALGNLVLVPTDGQRLGNPYYTPPGPETHMLVVKGYDPETNEFITNDPGTKRGEGYRYKVSILIDAILDYPTGYHEPVVGQPKAMIIVKK